MNVVGSNPNFFRNLFLNLTVTPLSRCLALNSQKFPKEPRLGKTQKGSLLVRVKSNEYQKNMNLKEFKKICDVHLNNTGGLQAQDGFQRLDDDRGQVLFPSEPDREPKQGRHAPLEQERLLLARGRRRHRRRRRGHDEASQVVRDRHPDVRHPIPNAKIFKIVTIPF